MAEQPHNGSFTKRPAFRLLAALVVVVILAAAAWFWLTAGRESTDDGQVDADVTPIAARISGVVSRIPIRDNQQVEAGTILVELDSRDYEVAVSKARAELADAEAAAEVAHSTVPITTTTVSSNVTTAESSVEHARASVDQAQKELDAARARLASAQARQRESEANATKTARDVERLRGLLAKDEVSQQQFDATVATADAQRAAADSAVSLVAEAQAGIRVADTRLVQARAIEQQAQAGLRTAQTAPQQIAATRARAASADARVLQAKSALEQADLNLQYTTIKAPVRGVVSRKTVEVGRVVQVGQPLLALIPLDTVWVTANFKETQIANMRPGQAVTIKVDSYGGRQFRGKIDSIAAATGARFSLLPPENATGNYVKVVQRIPVKITIEGAQDPEHVLRPGMSVETTVFTR